MANFLISVSTALAVLSLLAYGDSIIRKRTLLCAGAGLLFSVNTLLAVIKTQLEIESPTASLEILGLWTFAVGNVLILVLAICVKQTAKIELKTDFPLATIAVALLLAYLTIDKGEVMIALSVAIECLATGWIVLKMLKHPNQEALSPWVVSLGSYFLSFLAQLIQGHEGHEIWFSLVVSFNIFIVCALAYWQKTRKN